PGDPGQGCHEARAARFALRPCGARAAHRCAHDGAASRSPSRRIRGAPRCGPRAVPRAAWRWHEAGDDSSKGTAMTAGSTVLAMIAFFAAGSSAGEAFSQSAPSAAGAFTGEPAMRAAQGPLGRTQDQAIDGERWSSYRRSEEHTSELQSHLNLVCRLLREKNNKCE